MNILQKIINDHYEEIQYTLHPRHSVMDNINRMVNCGDPSFGGAMYACTHCGNFKFVPFRCKSRFCPTCGNKYSIDRTTSMSFQILHGKHRHCVFTIADELRPFFLKDRSLLGCLFSAVRSVILRMFHKDNKTELFTPGFILVLHTFGRDLKWNPHIHCLVSEGGLGNSGFWRNKTHFNYTFLRNAFQTALLKELKKHLPDSFKKTITSIYKNHKNGFYVYAKQNRCDSKHVIKYIGRYLGRPVIATSRIDAYDTLEDTVTFHYNRHEDDKYIVETIPSMEFIERLLQHIPEKHFKQIRYYGLYARKNAEKYKFNLAIHKSKHKFLLSLNRWRECIALSFGYDPISCPCCKNKMELLEIYYNHKRVPLDERYEKVMADYRASHPPSCHSLQFSSSVVH